MLACGRYFAALIYFLAAAALTLPIGLLSGCRTGPAATRRKSRQSGRWTGGRSRGDGYNRWASGVSGGKGAGLEMQTVNFQCGHCGNLMAVGVEHLGQQVRCPHCQQVVIAPASAVTTPPAAESAPAPDAAENPFAHIRDSEDIFHQPRDTDDALFGSEGPRLELQSLGLPVRRLEPVAHRIGLPGFHHLCPV